MEQSMRQFLKSIKNRIEIGEICCTHRPIFKAHEEEPATGKAE